MTTLFGLIWWAFIGGAAWQAWKAWGPSSAVAAVVGLYFAAVLLPLGSVLTMIAAVAIGARAEGAQQKQIAAWRS